MTVPKIPVAAKKDDCAPSGRPLTERPCAIYFDDKRRAAHQGHKAQCDVHEILKVFNATGFMPERRVAPPFADCRVPTDPMVIAGNARNMQLFFTSLSPDIRAKFSIKDHNNKLHFDSLKMVQFMSNPDNLEECFKLGILKRPVSAAKPTEPAPPASPAPPAPSAPAAPPSPPPTPPAK